MENESLRYFKSLKIRTILLEGTWQKSTSREVFGSISYIRNHYEGYDYEKGDYLDKKILELANVHFLSATTVVNEPILFRGQQDYFVNLNNFTTVKWLEINLSPITQITGTSKTFIRTWETKLIRLNVCLQTFDESMNMNMNNYLFSKYKFHIPFPQDETEKISKTISAEQRL